VLCYTWRKATWNHGWSDCLRLDQVHAVGLELEELARAWQQLVDRQAKERQKLMDRQAQGGSYGSLYHWF
jgi:hypothetical protein